MRKPKIKWKGIFNYSREVFVLYAHAFSKAQAREIFFRRLSTLHNVSITAVRNHFLDDTDNFSIEEEK
jgi:hypothetical protein